MIADIRSQIKTPVRGEYEAVVPSVYRTAICGEQQCKKCCLLHVHQSANQDYYALLKWKEISVLHRNIKTHTHTNTHTHTHIQEYQTNSSHGETFSHATF